ncbi:MAG TPA: FprA family A-type flavoprotein [Thermoanaerobaculia bacterium]|nr:FprA family A-type flavoprotein [Thermoanaerobaculia bacterium]
MTTIQEVADNIFRISTPLPPEAVPGGFSFNQYLIRDDAPLVFHTGPRRIFPLVRDAIESVMPIAKLRYVGFSHVEADESGALNELLRVAPGASPVCSTVAALVSISDMADRAPIGLADGQTLSLGDHTLRWLDAPHMPHGWETGYLFEESTKTLLCGDLFTQPGPGGDAVTEGDILGPSEAFRAKMDYYSYTKNARPLLEKLAATKPTTLACMHGSAWRGDGAAMLMALADAFTS